MESRLATLEKGSHSLTLGSGTKPDSRDSFLDSVRLRLGKIFQ
jgi:hypothetical protein